VAIAPLAATAPFTVAGRLFWQLLDSDVVVCVWFFAVHTRFILPRLPLRYCGLRLRTTFAPVLGNLRALTRPAPYAGHGLVLTPLRKTRVGDSQLRRRGSDGCGWRLGIGLRSVYVVVSRLVVWFTFIGYVFHCTFVVVCTFYVVTHVWLRLFSRYVAFTLFVLRLLRYVAFCYVTFTLIYGLDVYVVLPVAGLRLPHVCTCYRWIWVTAVTFVRSVCWLLLLFCCCSHWFVTVGFGSGCYGCCVAVRFVYVPFRLRLRLLLRWVYVTLLRLRVCLCVTFVCLTFVTFCYVYVYVLRFCFVWFVVDVVVVGYVGRTVTFTTAFTCCVLRCVLRLRLILFYPRCSVAILRLRHWRPRHLRCCSLVTFHVGLRYVWFTVRFVTIYVTCLRFTFCRFYVTLPRFTRLRWNTFTVVAFTLRLHVCCLRSLLFCSLDFAILLFAVVCVVRFSVSRWLCCLTPCCLLLRCCCCLFVVVTLLLLFVCCCLFVLLLLRCLRWLHLHRWRVGLFVTFWLRYGWFLFFVVVWFVTLVTLPFTFVGYVVYVVRCCLRAGALFTFTTYICSLHVVSHVYVCCRFTRCSFPFPFTLRLLVCTFTVYVVCWLHIRSRLVCCTHLLLFIWFVVSSVCFVDLLLLLIVSLDLLRCCLFPLHCSFTVVYDLLLHCDLRCTFATFYVWTTLLHLTVVFVLCSFTYRAFTARFPTLRLLRCCVLRSFPVAGS